MAKKKEFKTTREIFRSNLTSLMEQHNMNGSELAIVLESTSASVSRWMSGMNIPNPKTLDLMCTIFEVRPRDFYKED